MPALVVSEIMTSEDSKELKKKMKIDSRSDSDEVKKKDKKRKALNLYDDNEENGSLKQMPLREALVAKGINALFPIQALTFDTILDGSDLVGRARTGQGKTLAFVLPILESLINGPTKVSRKTGYGRAPSVLLLLPTRELALQVFADFEVYGGAVGITSCCLYGNSPMGQQEVQLKRGVDIVVGTPGRVKDHIERGNIDFRSLQFRVLDEVDEMLKIGFVDDVEFILGKVEDASQVQTLLFSATLPSWVKHISSKFLKPDKKTVDLVGDEKMKASKNVRHIIIPCTGSARSQLIPDILRCYSSGGRTIIFTETRGYASELAGILPGARALHGEIQQPQREITLSGFRSGKFLTLVATNVAARGLDIDNVQLIIQCEPPRDVEAYIHRSGRTGRAGNTGVAVMLYDPKKSNISKIERESGVKFEHLSAPQPADVAKAAGKEAAEAVAEISDSVIPAFKAAAEELLHTSELSPAELLAKALAKAAGYSEIKSRSLLSSMENCVTLLLECGRPIFSPSFAYNVLRGFLPEDKVELIKGLTLTADGKGAVFDVSSDELDTFLAGKNAQGVSMEVVKELPRLQEKDQARGGRFGGSHGGFSDRRGGGRFSGGRGGRGGGRGYGNFGRR
ncbi:DEAD-box ATP-dependent RNA helicase 7 [Capsicum annuum]|uniref:RNA helicase n=1 Tax=Capsicum annuum TaxID=4072 RepID=A0A2G2ZYN5_CAPAN|nr:DEAD-box ATP-dependent RNA helicase 7 [Capsicum annuum]